MANMSWAWTPFLLAWLNRAVPAISLILWLEGFMLGLTPTTVRSVAFYCWFGTISIMVVHSMVSTMLGARTPCLELSSETGTFYNETVSWAASGMRGWRPHMEDAHVVELLKSVAFPDVAIFAVLDGHGGKDVSELASHLLCQEIRAAAEELQVSEDRDSSKEVEKDGKRRSQEEAVSLEQALRVALPRLDEELRRGALGLGSMLPGLLHPFCGMGSTAVVAAVDLKSREVVVANVGDSRAILIRNGKALALSEDHKPENPKERHRIQQAGGRVVKCGSCHRVDGNLNLSRALGDFYLKANHELPADKQKVSAFPDTTRTKFKGGPNELLLVACDGLFERMSNQDVADLVWPRIKRGMPLKQVAEELLKACCARAGRNGQPIEPGTDNESVIFVKLPVTPDATTAAADADGDAGSERLAPGRRVLISGLQSDAGRQYNGLEGIVEDPSEATERYCVRLVDTDEVKSFKPANLSPV
eukprot:TRINITY_DN44768_c0_g1_i1.p1 TRINITY_DN44768_c0_g1~~TRINITY_DN44768_c0_g1_i1.p1  ORF type:complete len:475 (-),score=102.41 TRINITY_DN44768_c0_g1_i1:75-1499(-)